MIPHGKRISDLAIEIVSAGRAVPIVSYEQIPLPPEESAASRTVVSDGSGRRKALWAPDDESFRETMQAVRAEPDLWPTGAALRFDGGRTADGAASVAFSIEKAPEPERPAAEVTSEPPEQPATELQTGPSPAGTPASPPAANVQNEPPSPSSETDEPPAPALPRIRQPDPLVLVAYRHRIDIAAPDSFSIMLRARERAFGIGVRSDRESSDPRLSYRAPGAEPVSTHLVPQVGVIVSRCGRPVEEVLRDIRSTDEREQRSNVRR
jgi:hypothetical protein